MIKIQVGLGVHSLAGLKRLLTVMSVKEALSVVACLITAPIHEHIPTVDGSCAVTPGIYAQRTVIAVKLTCESVALFITAPVSRLGSTVVQLTFL